MPGPGFFDRRSDWVIARALPWPGIPELGGVGGQAWPGGQACPPAQVDRKGN